MHRTTFTGLSALTLVAAAGLLTAGPLTPPAGPVASTYKTLAEIEPRMAINAANTPGDSDATPSVYKITQRGSYYLTGNVLGVAAKHGIEITAANVTLDLNGYAVVGAAGSLSGICITSPLGVASQVEVRNGNVSNWGGDGVDLGTGSYCRIADVACMSNGGSGMDAGNYGMVLRCRAAINGANGIDVYSTCVVTECMAEGNGGDGIAAGNSGDTITRCTSTGNAGNGISASSACTLAGCAAMYNGMTGIVVYSSTLSECVSTANSGYGIDLDQYSVAHGCTSRMNTFAGFSLGDGSFVTGCSAIQNGNGVAGRPGFSIAGANCRLEGNHAVQNVVGFSSGPGNNLFLGNSAVGNTGANFSIAAGNDSGAVITNPGVGFTTTNPAANYAP